jgi:hypothetical protein
MSDRPRWVGVVLSLLVVAFGAYTLVTGEWHFRREPSETMVRIGGGLIVFLGIVGFLASIGKIREETL